MNATTILFSQAWIAGFLYSITSFSGLILSVRYILMKNWITGFIFSLGVVTLQAVWSAVASLPFVLPAATSMNIETKWFSLFGAIVLFFMAYKMFKTKITEEHTKKVSATQTIEAYLMGITISIPFAIRILGYMGIFAALGVHHRTSAFNDIISLVLGVTIGSVCWWFLFTLVIAHLREKVSLKTITLFNKIAAWIFVALGVLSMIPFFE